MNGGTRGDLEDSGPGMLAAVYLWLLRRRQTACSRCPHDRSSHHSYVPGGSRPGYCAACKCYQYKPERPWALAMAYLRKRPEPVTADILKPRPVRLPLPDPALYDDKTEFGIRVAPYLGRPRDRGAGR